MIEYAARKSNNSKELIGCATSESDNLKELLDEMTKAEIKMGLYPPDSIEYRINQLKYKRIDRKICRIIASCSGWY